MTKHAFFFSEGTWIGEGIVGFSASPDEIKFHTKWHIDAQILTQEVELDGIGEKTINRYTLSSIDESSFQIELTNALLDKVVGKGVYTPSTISWEFNIPDVLVGHESYEKVDENLYSFNAEYSSEEFFKTIIRGRIWKI